MKQLLRSALQARGYATLTPVQEAVTAPELAQTDLLVSAQTGSGKTVGFGLAIAPAVLGEAETFGPAAAPLALVIAPTRELALQVRRELAWLYAEAGAVLASCVGGMDARTERRALERGAHILVATPGRLCDHLRRGAVDLGALRAVVLDEADEMLDLGFREDLETILDAAPADRQTLLFSATVSPGIAELAKTYQREARRISVEAAGGQHSDIAYRAVMVADHDEENAITNLLRFHEAPNAIVFANTRAAVARLVSRLSNRGFPVVGLSGELSQAERSHALQAMRDGRARVCVATDVAARGIDLPNLDLVIHAELPLSTEALLHRSGRTGRAGRKGISALIVPPRARRRAERMLREAKLEAEWEAAPSADAVLARDEARLLADPVWAEPATEAEADSLGRILAAHGAEGAALAMLRLWRGQRSAPEELLPVAPREEPRSVTGGTARGPAFGPSRWFALPADPDRKLSPRWLMPKICEAGGITRAEIGAIRFRNGQCYIEIAEEAADAFVASLGPAMAIGPGLVLTPVAGLAETPRPARPAAPRKSYAPAAEGWAPKKSYAPAEGRPRKPGPGADRAPSGPAQRFEGQGFEARGFEARGGEGHEGRPKGGAKFAPGEGKSYKTGWAKPKPRWSAAEGADSAHRDDAKRETAKPAPRRADPAPAPGEAGAAAETGGWKPKTAFGKPKAGFGKAADKPAGKGAPKKPGKPGAAFGKPRSRPAGFDAPKRGKGKPRQG